MFLKVISYYYNAVSMAELQIGELTGHLSDEFKEKHNTEIPWKDMRAMRNRFAHEYIGMDKSFVWEVVVNDIPVLKAFCEKQLADSPPSAGNG